MSRAHNARVHPRLTTTALIQETDCDRWRGAVITKSEAVLSLGLLRCKFQKVCVQGFSALAVCSSICFTAVT